MSEPVTHPTPPAAEIRAAVLAGLARIAPEVDPATLRGDASLREQVDLDSMDFLNLVIGLSESLGVEVPEADYPKLATLDGCVAYLAASGARSAPTS
jgi:acyl carrier protein